MTNRSIIGLRELRENTESFIREVEKGKSFTIVRRSRPIFKITPVDEWGDEGSWETVFDFRSIKKQGFSPKELLKHLRKVNG